MTDQELAALKVKIADAENEYHQLSLGLKPRVIVDQNGERVEFTATNRQSLYAYIQSLKAQLPGSCAPGYTRPLGFLF